MTDLLSTAGPGGTHLALDPLEHRTEDYKLTAEQRDMLAVVRRVLSESVPPHEPQFEPCVRPDDPDLWRRLAELGLHGIGITPDAGGDGGDLIDVVLLAEEYGRALVPAPFADTIAAARALAAGGASRSSHAGDLLKQALLGESFVVPAGMDLTAFLAGPTIGLPDAAPRAVLEHRLLTAAALIGAATRATELAIDFACSRATRGVPIGSLQGISHPLVTCAVKQEAGRNLVRRAAWYAEHNPQAHAELVPAALIHAIDTASESAEVAVHVHGGGGVCLESEVSAYFLWIERSILLSAPRADLIAEFGDWLAAASAHQDGDH